MKSLLEFDLKTLLFIVLVGVIIFQHCNGSKKEMEAIIKIDNKNYELLDQKIDTIYQEKIVEIPKYIPRYVDRLVYIPIEIPIDVDTLTIIEDYFSSFKIIDTVQLKYKFSKSILDEIENPIHTSLGYGIITDVISQNKIQSRDIIWNFQIPTIYDTKIVKELPKNQIYMGLTTSFDRVNVVNSIGMGVILKTKKDRIYQFNTGLSNTITSETLPYVGGGLYWKIKLRK
jgi:hypothetical protein